MTNDAVHADLGSRISELEQFREDFDEKLKEKVGPLREQIEALRVGLEQALADLEGVQINAAQIEGLKASLKASNDDVLRLSYDIQGVASALGKVEERAEAAFSQAKSNEQLLHLLDRSL